MYLLSDLGNARSGQIYLRSLKKLRRGYRDSHIILNGIASRLFRSPHITNGFIGARDPMLGKASGKRRELASSRALFNTMMSFCVGLRRCMMTLRSDKRCAAGIQVRR